jgi:hypothetical protein
MTDWKYQNAEISDTEGVVRKFVIATFELICLAGVIIPTLVAMFVEVVMIFQDRNGARFLES